MVGALRDLVPVVQLKKVEQHPWTSVTFSKFAGYKASHLFSPMSSLLKPSFQECKWDYIKDYSKHFELLFLQGRLSF